MSATTNTATTKDVMTALVALGFQPQVETIKTISHCCRDQFLSHLAKCVSNLDTDGMSMKAISSLIASLSAETLGRIRGIAADISPAQVAHVALRTPTKLASAISAAEDPAHPRHLDAKEFLAEVSRLEITTTVSAGAPQSAVPGVALSREQKYSNNAQAESTTSAAPRTSSVPRMEARYNSCHVYGSAYALCFNAISRNGSPGVMVDAASSTGPRSYDWKNAVHVWLDTNEVGAVLAVFRRWRRSVEFSAHGPQNDKAFSLEFQEQHFFARVVAKGCEIHPARAVKILPMDATAISILFLTQLAQSYPQIPLNELLATVRATHQITDAAPR